MFSQKNSSRCCQLLILSWSELVLLKCLRPTLYTAYLLQSLASVWQTVPCRNHIFNPQLNVVIIFLAFQTPKQALQVLQTPSVQSSSHPPFLHSLTGNKYIVMSGDPLEPFSPEIAYSSKIPDSRKHHVRLILLLAEDRLLLHWCCMLSLPGVSSPPFPCHPIGFPASAGQEAPEFHTPCSLTPADHIEAGLKGFWVTHNDYGKLDVVDKGTERNLNSVPHRYREAVMSYSHRLWGPFLEPSLHLVWLKQNMVWNFQ